MSIKMKCPNFPLSCDQIQIWKKIKKVWCAEGGWNDMLGQNTSFASMLRQFTRAQQAKSQCVSGKQTFNSRFIDESKHITLTDIFILTLSWVSALWIIQFNQYILLPAIIRAFSVLQRLTRHLYVVHQGLSRPLRVQNPDSGAKKKFKCVNWKK